MQTLQSQALDSVENDKTHEETQGQANHESREASGPGFAAPNPATGPEAPPEEILPIHIWKPFENKTIDEVKVTASIQPVCSQTHPQN